MGPSTFHGESMSTATTTSGRPTAGHTGSYTWPATTRQGIRPAKAGDVLHLFTSGAFETFTDVSIDAAGNVWCANNWNDVPIATGMTQDLARSTWGGGTGINVIYGVAEPVQPPRMGKVGRP